MPGVVSGYLGYIDIPIYLLFISQCVCITACGNFAIVGMTTGHLEMFNMQSGLHRGVIGKGKGQ